MPILNKIQQLERLDQLIRLKATGTPAELAEKLNISKRQVHNIIDEMKADFSCPIVYSKIHNSYVYEKQGKLKLKCQFEQPLGNSDLENLEGGSRSMNPVSFFNYFETNFSSAFFLH
jgi:hypothetical protein